jgi:uncharacterized protein
MLKHRVKILIFFAILCIVCAISLRNLQVKFEFEQFFPQGDDDVEFFNKFTSEFDKDDSFLLVSLNNDGAEIFDTTFMKRMHDFSIACRDLNNVEKVQSLTSIKYPLKTPFGYSLLPLLHMSDSEKLKEDKKNILSDDRFSKSFVSADGKSINVLLKTTKDIAFAPADSLMDDLEVLLKKYNFDGSRSHILGRASFQSALVTMESREVIVSTLVSAVLLSIIIYLIYGSWYAVFVTMISIGASLLIFMGILAMTGRPLSLMSALYPIIVLIVGSSDVIHVMTKYIDTVTSNETRFDTMKLVIKEIGYATFLTSFTNAIGFLSLVTSRLNILKEFGINSFFGVMLTFAVVIVVLPCLLVMVDIKKLKTNKGKSEWLNKIAINGYNNSKKYPARIIAIFAVVLLISFYGMSKITTNYKIIHNLPVKGKVTEDFLFFEKNFAGFRPLEFAITVKEPYKANDFEIVKEIDKVENKIKSTGVINSVISQATIYKSIEMANNGNQKASYKMPDSLYTFLEYQGMIAKMKNLESSVLINKYNNKTRISSIISDIGADSVAIVGKDIDNWVKANIDSTKMSVRRTGTGLVLDKNNIYVKENLLYSLVLSIIVISLLMAMMVKNFKMLIISLIPNLIPLFFVAAVLGFFNIQLDAGISIIFSVIYSIAVDDTIHFLSRYKLCIDEGMGVEESLKNVFEDTGKSIVLTSIVLFFGFLIMLFSNYPPSVNVGVLTAFTLLSAMSCDLYLLPVLIRYFYKDKN